MRSGTILVGLGMMVLAACNKTSNPDLGSAPAASAVSTPPPVDTARARGAEALRGHEAWRMSAAKCPIELAAPPAPRPGVNLGDLALEQGHLVGEPNVSIVKSLDDGFSFPSGGGDAVPVLYVETSRIAPVLDAASQTFRAGSSEGTAYLFDRTAGKFTCMAKVRAESSSSVTSLGAQERQAQMWLTMDLMFAIEREITANARAIESAPDADAGPMDAGRSDGSTRPRK